MKDGAVGSCRQETYLEGTQQKTLKKYFVYLHHPLADISHHIAMCSPCASLRSGVSDIDVDFQAHEAVVVVLVVSQMARSRQG